MAGDRIWYRFKVAGYCVFGFPRLFFCSHPWPVISDSSKIILQNLQKTCNHVDIHIIYKFLDNSWISNLNPSSVLTRKIRKKKRRELRLLYYQKLWIEIIENKKLFATNEIKKLRCDHEYSQVMMACERRKLKTTLAPCCGMKFSSGNEEWWAIGKMRVLGGREGGMYDLDPHNFPKMDQTPK